VLAYKSNLLYDPKYSTWLACRSPQLRAIAQIPQALDRLSGEMQ
jgi:hypothetical protein